MRSSDMSDKYCDVNTRKRNGDGFALSIGDMLREQIDHLEICKST